MSKYLLTKEYLNKLYWKEELSTYKIAKIIGCSDQTVSYRMEKFGIRRRTHSEMVGKLGSTYGKYKDGIYYKDKKYYCIECYREICSKTWFYGSKKCRKCLARLKRETSRKSKQYYCKCGNKIHYSTYFYGSGECKSCALKDKKRPDISKRVSGKGNPNYKHGQSFSPYPEEFFKIKSKIRKRDNYTCQKCKQVYDKKSTKLHIHHIDSNKFNNKEDNLVCLCVYCHIDLHRKDLVEGNRTARLKN